MLNANYLHLIELAIFSSVGITYHLITTSICLFHLQTTDYFLLFSLYSPSETLTKVLDHVDLCQKTRESQQLVRASLQLTQAFFALCSMLNAQCSMLTTYILLNLQYSHLSGSHTISLLHQFAYFTYKLPTTSYSFLFIHQVKPSLRFLIMLIYVKRQENHNN